MADRSNAPPHAVDIDTLIHARWVVPIEPDNTLLEHHAVAVNGGKIVAVLPSNAAKRAYRARREVNLAQHVLLPGFVNLHTHAAMSLLRGYADDLPLMTWLREHIWPAEAGALSQRFVYDGSMLSAAEMLRGGVTCFSDMYFFPEETARAVQEMGIRAVLGIAVVEFATPYASDPEDYLAKGLSARDEMRDESLIGFTLAPHAPYTVSDRTFERIAVLAAQLDLPIHTHLHETVAEIEESLQQHGVRPIERLRRFGIVDAGLIAAHAVHLEVNEVQLLAQQGASIAHCPTSNMKLASGIAPIAAALAHGINVGLGTDGAASNNRLDMFHEMRHAALLGKVLTGDAAVLPAHQVLRMATLNGAVALGLGDRIGSIVAGKEADLCAVRLDDWIVQPCFDPISHLVYVAGREQVSHVWVAGKERLIDATLIDQDMTKLTSLAALWQNSVSGKRRLSN